MKCLFNEGDEEESGDESEDEALDGKLCTYTQTARYGRYTQTARYER